MIKSLKSLDQELFFWLNGFHNEMWDQVMFIISAKAVWFPLYAVLLGATVWHFRKYSIIFIIAAFASVGASDFVTSGIMKKSFERFRPSRDETIMDKVHIVNDYRGGKYGFASSHAANTFAIAMFFFLLLKIKYRWIWFLFIWAFVVSYSRIYLGVHYPGDILAGALVGLFFGWFFYKGSKIVLRRYYPVGYQYYFP